MTFSFERLGIPDVIVVTAVAHPDDRGYFVERYKRSEFEEFGMVEDFKQDNCSMSKKGVLRGLHYQLDPAAMGKLISVSFGKGWEVAVDIRRGSPYFGKWAGAELTPENSKAIWIPAGFAAGFISLEENTVLSYKVTNEYSKEHDRGIRWNDPAIGIKWPELPVPYIISEKDKKHPLLKDADINFVYKPK